jgi:hypothetical protein
MKEENPSIEDLLKSLRKTLSEKNKAAEETKEDILELTPNFKATRASSSIIDFVKEVFEKESEKVINDNREDLFSAAIEHGVSILDKDLIEKMAKESINLYVKNNEEKISQMIKSAIESKIASMIKIS